MGCSRAKAHVRIGVSLSNGGVQPEPLVPRKMSFLLGNHLLTHDLYLIVFVDRVFQGELEPAWEVYAKPVRGGQRGGGTFDLSPRVETCVCARLAGASVVKRMDD